MASKDPFNFNHADRVIPIVCIKCGNNAHCIRREANGARERQTFNCAACGAESHRELGPGPSDEAVEMEAKKLICISNPQAPPKLDPTETIRC